MNKILLGKGDSSKREVLFDILRGIAIILVTWGHVTNALFSGELIYYFPLKLISATFVMPLFMGICGFFSYKSIMKCDLKSYIFKRIKRILIPCIVWNIIGWLITSAVKVTLGDRSIPRFDLTGVWFLWAVFICEMIMLVQLKLMIKRNLLIASSVIISIILILCPTDLWYIAWVYPFFSIGVLLNFDCFKISDKVGWKIWLFCTTLYSIVLPLFKYEYLVYYSGSSIFGVNPIYSQLLIDLFRFIIGCLGCIAVIGFIKLIIEKLSDSNVISLIANIRRKSMEIYVMQVVFVETLLMMLIRYIKPLSSFFLCNVEFTVYCVGLLITILAIIAFLVVKTIVSKWHYLDIFLFG